MTLTTKNGLSDFRIKSLKGAQIGRKFINIAELGKVGLSKEIPFSLIFYGSESGVCLVIQLVY